MKFEISTPQTVREDVAKQKARRAFKRKAACGSDMEPAIRNPKQLPFPMSAPPDPAQNPAPTQSLVHTTTNPRPIGERPKLIDTSLPSSQAQAHEMTNLGPSTKKRKQRDHRSVTLAYSRDTADHGLVMKEPELDENTVPPSQAHDTDATDLEPAAKKQKLSYANLPPARVRVRMSEEESNRFYAGLYRRRLRGRSKSQGYDYDLLDQIPDALLLSPNFDPYKYMVKTASAYSSQDSQSANSHSDASGPKALDVSRFVNSYHENLMTDGPRFGAHCTSKQKLHDLSHHPQTASTPAQAHSIPDEVSVVHRLDQDPTGCPGSGDEICHLPSIPDTTAVSSSVFDGKVNETCPPLGGKTSASSTSSKSSLEGPFCSSSDANAGYSPESVNLDQTASIGSNCGTGNEAVAASSDQTAPLSLDASLRDKTTPASSSRTSSVSPAPNRGGRPRGRKPRTRRTPKGPTRFQKNRPVKSTVNIDVWENILVYCPLDFLLKARSVSTTFRSVLNDDSFIWKTARLTQFDPAMPDPPLGLSEPQYADLVTGTGCQTRGCTSKKTRKTYWALKKRLCVGCFQKSFLPPRALRRVSKELEMSATPQYMSIARYYWRMDEFLPGMRFDRWDNYQWLGEYNPKPSWGQHHRSGQYIGYPAAAYANFSSELAAFVGNEYDMEQGRFFSNEPMPGKTCPPQDAIDAWFEAKRAANDALVPELQAVENWCESLKRENQKAGKDHRKNRIAFYEEQAELAGLEVEVLHHFDAYQAAIAISKPVTLQSWKILLPKLLAESDAAAKEIAEHEESLSDVSVDEDDYEVEVVEGPIDVPTWD